MTIKQELRLLFNQEKRLMREIDCIRIRRATLLARDSVRTRSLVVPPKSRSKKATRKPADL
jgi:hypothetical protein